MLHIDIDTVWRFRKEGSPQTIVVMLRVLNEIRKTGKLTSAAADAGSPTATSGIWSNNGPTSSACRWLKPSAAKARR